MWKCFSQWKLQRMRTRRVSHLPVAKGTKQWTPRLQSTILCVNNIQNESKVWDVSPSGCAKSKIWKIRNRSNFESQKNLEVSGLRNFSLSLVNNYLFLLLHLLLILVPFGIRFYRYLNSIYSRFTACQVVYRNAFSSFSNTHYFFPCNFVFRLRISCRIYFF